MPRYFSKTLLVAAAVFTGGLVSCFIPRSRSADKNIPGNDSNRLASPSPAATLDGAGNVARSIDVTRTVFGDELNVRPDWSKLNSLRPEDLPQLISIYERAPLTNKVALAWAISHLGSDDVVAVLRNPLEQNYQGRQFGMPEILVFNNLLGALGYLGQRSDAAFRFLQESISPEAWKLRRSWIPSEEAVQDPDIVLTAYSVMSLAITGRPEVLPLINDLASGSEVYISELAGDLTTAAFYCDYIEKHGASEFIQKYFGRSMIRELREFFLTDSGKEWRKWYLAKKQLPENGKL